MKKLFFTFGLFVVSLAFGQMETVKFDRKLVYEQEVTNGKKARRILDELGALEYYHSSSYGLLRINPKEENYPYYSIGSYYMLFGKKFPFWAMIDAVDRTIAMNPRNIEEVSINRDILLNGAHDWIEYSYGGCSFIFDSDIAERLCTPSELKKKKGGELQPNSYELWLDVQARALNQACERLLKAFRDVKRKMQ